MPLRQSVSQISRALTPGTEAQPLPTSGAASAQVPTACPVQTVPSNPASNLTQIPLVSHISPILQKRQWRLREVEWLFPSHTARKPQRFLVASFNQGGAEERAIQNPCGEELGEGGPALRVLSWDLTCSSV